MASQVVQVAPTPSHRLRYVARRGPYFIVFDAPYQDTVTEFSTANWSYHIYLVGKAEPDDLNPTIDWHTAHWFGCGYPTLQIAQNAAYARIKSFMRQGV